ncbi:unnamed protein product, partial [Rotaria sp. Silwood1]
LCIQLQNVACAIQMRVYKGELSQAGVQIMGRFRHGLDSSKIVAVIPLIEHGPNIFIGTGHTAAKGYLVDWFVDTVYFQFKVPKPFYENTVAISQRPYRVTIMYTDSIRIENNTHWS